MWSLFLVFVSTRAAAFWIHCRDLRDFLEQPDDKELQLSNLEVTNAWTSFYASFCIRYVKCYILSTKKTRRENTVWTRIAFLVPFTAHWDLQWADDPDWCVLCLSGGAVEQNGHTTAEIQEEVALTNMGTVATTEKRHSHVNNDKLHFPRANLQTITTLGRLI